MKAHIIKLLLLISFVYVIFLFIESDFFLVKKVNVEGNISLVKEDISSKFDKLKGEKIFSLDLSEMRNRLEEDVRIESVNISRKFPDTINVNIEERIPIGIISKNNKYYYIDKNLNIFAYYKEVKEDNLPIIDLKEENVEDIKELLSNVLNTKIYNIISEIYQEKDMYVLTLLDGTDVYTYKEIDSKKYEIAYNIYIEEIKENHLEYIDLRFKDIAVK
ncbi:FtsQ-type POTRA domain-containing protein [Streptobacillus felis]|uniref:FtsQ-type POTRA domain-containing protein n=1 Tax=Streptobacillus felis TaxID=1384509 RepID=A0A7Z0TA53_9FUSO|nr:FtsQ-type POTRA domain-containing protein [Streptobacillus felis]NYV27637.1 FtsQ-type POTRA domain-containing protein [Streptobacillus felis]